MGRKARNRNSSLGTQIIGRLREFADSLESGEPITERFTCREITLDLLPTRYSPELVRETRELLNVSQPLFATFLGTSTNTVRAWEQGVNAPSHMASRFMDEIRQDPTRFRARLRKLLTRKRAAIRR